MCGIVGIIQKGSKIDESILIKMRDLLNNRGPNDKGLFINKRGNVGLGHTRLSILDLSKKGIQPMKSLNKEIYIVFNGEIYNYLELREELQACGYSFNSKSDTEVLLYSYEEWGVNCIEKFKACLVLRFMTRITIRYY